MFAVIADEGTGAIVGVTELGKRTMTPAGARVAYIGNVAVGASQRRSGVGRRLVGFACKWARSRWDCADVFAHVEEDNAPARALYESLGFSAHVDVAGEGGSPGAVGGVEGGPLGALAGSRQVLLVRRGGARPTPS
ncbi:acyl-CoA N-acyltransferase [Pavlovales sp. CCMP2436]|nr:acyl-CoA N-acyltransferase [Pavlovales sp. CCMP2436]